MVKCYKYHSVPGGFPPHSTEENSPYYGMFLMSTASDCSLLTVPWFAVPTFSSSSPKASRLGILLIPGHHTGCRGGHSHEVSVPGNLMSLYSVPGSGLAGQTVCPCWI